MFIRMEKEMLEKMFRQKQEDWLHACREVDDLRKENKRREEYGSQCDDEIQKLLAENASLQELLGKYHDVPLAEKLADENARLREALENAVYDFDRILSADWNESQMMVCAQAASQRTRLVLKR